MNVAKSLMLVRNSTTSREFDDVGGLLTFGAGDDVEFDAVTFAEGFEFVASDAGVMHKNVRAAIVAADEAETFRVVEPLHDALHGKQFISGQ